jgi:hypothetical protein
MVTSIKLWKLSKSQSKLLNNMHYHQSFTDDILQQMRSTFGVADVLKAAPLKYKNLDSKQTKIPTTFTSDPRHPFCAQTQGPFALDTETLSNIFSESSYAGFLPTL